MVATVEYVWFIESLSDLTNEYISRELQAENAEREVLCNDGKKRDMWRCKYKFISRLKRERLDQALEYNVFVRTGEKGQARPATFIVSKTSRRKRAEKITRKFRELAL